MEYYEPYPTFCYKILYNKEGDNMKTVQSFLVMLAGILLFYIAMPYLWILVLIIVAGFLYLSWKTKKVVGQAKKDIHQTWNDQPSNNQEIKRDGDIIDVEYEEREIKD